MVIGVMMSWDIKGHETSKALSHLSFPCNMPAIRLTSRRRRSSHAICPFPFSSLLVST